MLNTTKPRIQQSHEGSQSNSHKKFESSSAQEKPEEKEIVFPGLNNSDDKASDKEDLSKINDISVQDKDVTAKDKVFSAK